MNTLSTCSLNNLPISRNKKSIEKNVKRKIEYNKYDSLVNIKKTRTRGSLQQTDILQKILIESNVNLIHSNKELKKSRGALQTTNDSLQRMGINLNSIKQRQEINLIPPSESFNKNVSISLSVTKKICPPTKDTTFFTSPNILSNSFSNSCIKKNISNKKNIIIESNSTNIKSNENKENNKNSIFSSKSSCKYNPKIHNLDDFQIIKESKPFELDKINLWPYLIHFIKSCATIDIRYIIIIYFLYLFNKFLSIYLKVIFVSINYLYFYLFVLKVEEYIN
jgi:hypothetical protein